MSRAIQRAADDPPGAWWYGVALAVLVAGGVLIYQVASSFLTNLEGGFHQIVVPGEKTIALKKAGTYTIFHEKRSVVDGVAYATSNLAGLKVTVRNALTSEPVEVRASSASMTYSFNSREGESAFEFTVPKPGRYTIAAGYQDATSTAKTVLAIGEGFMTNLIGFILSVIGGIFGTLGVALYLFISTLIKRNRAKRNPA